MKCARKFQEKSRNSNSPEDSKSPEGTRRGPTRMQGALVARPTPWSCHLATWEVGPPFGSYFYSRRGNSKRIDLIFVSIVEPPPPMLFLGRVDLEPVFGLRRGEIVVIVITIIIFITSSSPTIFPPSMCE